LTELRGEPCLIAAWNTYPESARETWKYLSAEACIGDILAHSVSPVILVLDLQDINRGVAYDDLSAKFPETLTRTFPNLQCLSLKQNYTICEHKSRVDDAIGAFSTHPWIRNLVHLPFGDIQSPFTLSPELLMTSLPDDHATRPILSRVMSRPGIWYHTNYVDESKWESITDDPNLDDDIEPESNWDGISNAERKRLCAKRVDRRAPRPGVGCDRVVSIIVEKKSSLHE